MSYRVYTLQAAVEYMEKGFEGIEPSSEFMLLADCNHQLFQLRTTIERLETENAELKEQMAADINYMKVKGKELQAAEGRASDLQAQIDRLMLEYCPDEMTPEQIENYERNQQALANQGGEEKP